VNAKILKISGLIDKALLVPNDVVVVAEVGLFLAFVDAVQLHFLGRVDLVADEAFHLVDAGVCAVT
jgi:hypothetical protein